MKYLNYLIAGLIILLAVACEGGGGSSSMRDREMVALEVSPASVTLPKGVSQQFRAVAIYDDQSTEDVTSSSFWSTSNPGVANVLPATGLVTGTGSGECTIWATFNGMDGYRDVLITPEELERLEVSPGTSAAAGMTRQFVATGVFTDNSVKDLTTQVSWSTSDAGIAAVNSTGLVTFLQPGDVEIRASSISLASVAGSVNVNVTSATLERLDISPLSASIPKGMRQTFVAQGIFSDKTTRIIPNATWKSSSPEVAAITAAGVATGLSAGTTDITATYDGKTATAPLSVRDVPLTGIQVTPFLRTTSTGTTVSYAAMGIFSDHTNHDLTALATWYSSDDSVAPVSNSTKGLATALSAGVTTITAVYGSISGAAELTVTGASLTELRVTTQNPFAGTLPDPLAVVGSTFLMQAAAVCSDGTVVDVTRFATWSSSSPGVASVSNVARGNITPLSAGLATITANFGTLSSSLTLTVYSQSSIASFHVTPSLPKIARETTQAFRATVITADNFSIDVTNASFWSSSSDNVAKVSNVSVGVATGLSAGTTEISAGFAGRTASSTLTVTGATPVLLRVAPITVTIGARTNTTLAATADFSDGTFQTVSALSTWESSDESKVKVSNAVRGACTGLSAGTSTIRATYRGLMATADVTVTAASLDYLMVEPFVAKLAENTVRQYTATGVYSDNTVQDLTGQSAWHSSNSSVATVDNSVGGFGRVFGKIPGTTTISANFGGVSGAASLEVTSATLVSLQVTPFVVSLPVGYTQSFAATGIFSDNSVQTMTDMATWRSSSESVMAISNVIGSKGLATGISSGSTTITASWGNIVSGP